MKSNLIIFFSCVIFLIACNNDENEAKISEENKLPDTTLIENLPENREKIINIEHLPDTTGERLEAMKKWRIKEDAKPDFPIDTISLNRFWNNFQENIRSNNKKAIIEVLEFPVHAIHPVLFRYAHDCDTVAYIKNEEKYASFDIDKNNINEFFDFVFSEVLKEIIEQTSTQDLLKKGHRSKTFQGLTYTFFPKNYKVKVNCPNDHNLKFYLSYDNSNWRIGIGGL